MESLTTSELNTISCDSAQEFLSKLSPSYEAFWGINPTDWIFRGHSDALWSLLPSALRIGELKSYKRTEPILDSSSAEGIMEPTTAQEILAQEFRAVNSFFHLCDENGLRIPGDSHEHRTNEGRMQIRDMLKSIRKGRVSAIWPPNHWHPIYAIAQHYGIQTRLLDWTRKSRVAAYFAACAAAKSSSPPASICVWAINITHLISWQHVIFDEDKSRLTLRFVTPARSENPNLHAQAGLFSLDGDPTRRISLDKLLLMKISKKASDGILSCYHKNPGILIKKITLPGNCARSLLRLLAHESISAASIYPGYRGVAKSLKEREFWD